MIIIIIMSRLDNMLIAEGVAGPDKTGSAIAAPPPVIYFRFRDILSIGSGSVKICEYLNTDLCYRI